MTPVIRLAIGGAIGVLMLTAAIVSVLHRQPVPTVTVALPEDEPVAANHDDLARCRAITMPESGCDAAWAAKRRRFFGKDSSQ